jgi:hypothetical protein
MNAAVGTAPQTTDVPGAAVARAIAGTVSRALSIGVSHDMPAAC